MPSVLGFNRSTGCSHRTPPRCRCCSTCRRGWRSTCCRRPGAAGRRSSCPAGTPLCWFPSAARWWWCRSSPAPASCRKCAASFLEPSSRPGDEKHEERTLKMSYKLKTTSPTTYDIKSNIKQKHLIEETKFQMRICVANVTI